MTETSPLVKLAQSAALVFVASVVGRLLGLVAEIVIVRSLAPTTYGRIALAFTIISSLGSIILLGVHEGVTRQFSSLKSDTEQLKVVLSGYTIVLASGIFTALIVYSLRHPISELVNDENIVVPLSLFIPYLVIYPLSVTSFATLRAREQTLKAMMSRPLGGRLVALLLLGLFFSLGENYYGAIVYWIAFPAFTLLFSVYFMRDFATTNAVSESLPDRTTIVDLFAFSWPLAISSVVFLLLANLDILMIGYFLDAESVGFYRSVQPFKQVATFGMSAFTFIFLPLATRYYEQDRIDQLEEMFTVSTKWILLITLPPLLVFALFSGAVVQHFFGNEYLPASPVLAVLTGGLLFRAISGLDGPMVKAIDRPRIELYSAIPGFVVNFVMNVVLIPAYGIVGAAVATILGYAVYNSIELGWIYFSKDIHPFSIDTTKFLVAMIAFGGGLSVVIPRPLGILGLIGLGVVFVLVQPLLLLLTRSIDEEDIRLIDEIESRFGIDLTKVKQIAKKGV
ncbi:MULTISPECIES: flippase [Haloarcula]|uniref:flippase n=1 Tax=Haloarcula TaxID=2237 RepID=UPI0023EA88CE|nr:flippase [Halomicroarcula sp. XH51]